MVTLSAIAQRVVRSILERKIKPVMKKQQHSNLNFTLITILVLGVVGGCADIDSRATAKPVEKSQDESVTALLHETVRVSLFRFSGDTD